MDAFEQLDLTTEHNLGSVIRDPSGFMYVQYQNADNVVQPIEEGPGPLPILAWVDDLGAQPPTTPPASEPAPTAPRRWRVWNGTRASGGPTSVATHGASDPNRPIHAPPRGANRPAARVGGRRGRNAQACMGT